MTNTDIVLSSEALAWFLEPFTFRHPSYNQHSVERTPVSSDNRDAYDIKSVWWSAYFTRAWSLPLLCCAV